LVGEILRKRREEIGLNLRDVARITKIRYDFLKAIEDGAFEKLPVEAYVKGYIREYARVLDIDPEAVIDVYIRHISPPEDEKIIQKQILKRKGLKTQYLLISLLSVAMLASILFILFIFVPEKQEAPSVTFETEKEDLFKVKDTNHTVEISAIDTTWLLVTIDGTISKEILLRPGDSVKWDAKNNVSLTIGNAGGIRLIFDGEEIGLLGEQGEVMRLNLPSSEL